MGNVCLGLAARCQSGFLSVNFLNTLDHLRLIGRGHFFYDLWMGLPGVVEDVLLKFLE